MQLRLYRHDKRNFGREVYMAVGRDVGRWWTGMKRLGLQYAESRTAHATQRRDAFDVRALRRETRGASEALIRGACQSAYLHDRDAVCRCLGRYRLFVSTDDIGFSTFILLDGYWEMSVTEAFVELLKPGMKVADCGANLGYYTLLAADLVGSEGRVFAYEPNPQLTRRLTSSIHVNGFTDRVVLHPHALGDITGEIVMAIPPEEPKNGHWTDLPLTEMDHAKGLIAVPQRCLDDSLRNESVDFIKIDVEGSEERLWNGMSGILGRRTPLTILLEFAADRYEQPAVFLDAILAHGFNTRIVTNEDGIQQTNRDLILSARGDHDLMLVLER